MTKHTHHVCCSASRFKPVGSPGCSCKAIGNNLTNISSEEVTLPTEDSDASENQRSTKRAVRRHHKQRMRDKARFIVGVIWNYATGNTKRPDIVQDAVHNADNITQCSCDACCNPRRSKYREKKGKTLQELKSDYDLEDEQL